MAARPYAELRAAQDELRSYLKGRDLIGYHEAQRLLRRAPTVAQGLTQCKELIDRRQKAVDRDVERRMETGSLVGMPKWARDRYGEKIAAASASQRRRAKRTRKGLFGWRRS